MGIEFHHFFMYDIFDVISQITGLKIFCGSMSSCIFYLIFFIFIIQNYFLK
jgi:hypothetical protein